MAASTRTRTKCRCAPHVGTYLLMAAVVILFTCLVSVALVVGLAEVSPVSAERTAGTLQPTPATNSPVSSNGVDPTRRPSVGTVTLAPSLGANSAVPSRGNTSVPTMSPSRVEQASSSSKSGTEVINFGEISRLPAVQFASALFAEEPLPLTLGLSKEEVNVMETVITISGNASSREVKLKTLAKLFEAAEHVLGVKAVRTGGQPWVRFDAISLVVSCRMALPKKRVMKNAFFQRLRSSLMNNSPGTGEIVDGLPSFEVVKAKAEGYTWECLKTPNIVVFMTDDQGWEDVGWRFDGKRSPTPNLDVFRQVSSELMQMYTAPLCSPSRAMFFTGRLAHHTGYGPAVTEGIVNHLSGNETLIGEILKANGYHCAIFGKWHLGLLEKRNRPENRGFDTVFGEGSIDYTSRMNTLTFNDKSISVMLQDRFASASGVSLFNGTDIGSIETYAGKNIPWYNDDKATGNEEKHQVDLLEEEVLRFLEMYAETGHNTKPLFSFIGSRMPHTPLIPPARYKFAPKLRYLFHAKSKWRQAYLRMVHAADAVFGKVVAKLEDTGMWKDTVFMFLTDNGGLSTDKGGASNYPLQGRKNLLWEGGIRVINLISGTGSSLAPLDEDAKGGKNHDLMHFVDWLPTLCTGIAGVTDYSNAWKCKKCTAHRNNLLDGLNLWRSIQAGGTQPIATSTRVLPLQVVPLLQSRVASGEVPIKQVLPRTSYDAQVYKGSRFERVIDFVNSNTRLTAHKKRFRKHGGGAIRMGRYKLILAASGTCVPAYPWECQAFEDRKTVSISPGSLEIWLRKFVPDALVDGKMPGHTSNLGYLFDIWKDPEEKINLLRLNLNAEESTALGTMLRQYAAEQLDAVLDGKITHGFAADPAVSWFVNKQFAWNGGCELSIHCNYD